MASTEGWVNGLRNNVEGWGANIGGRMKGAYAALTGAAPSPDVDALRSTDPGTTVTQEGQPVKGNPVPQGQRPVPADFTVDPAGNARPAGMRAPALPGPNVSGQQPAWGAGASPEAQAFAAEKAAQDASFANAGKGAAPAPAAAVAEEAGASNGLRNSVSKALTPTGFSGKVAGLLGRASGPLAAGAEFLDPNVRSAVDPTSDDSWQDRVKAASRSALRVGGGMLGTVGGAAAGTAVLPVAGTLAGGVAGGAGGYTAGNKVADWLLGPEKQTGPMNKPAAAPVAEPAGGGGGSGGGGEVMSGHVGGGFQTLRGKAKINANDFINGTDVPEPGEGYIRNNTTGAVSHRMGGGGNRGYVTGDGEGGGGGVASGLRNLAGKGAFGGMAAMGIQGAVDRMKSNQVNASLRGAQAQATNALAQARQNYEMGKDARDYATGREDYNTKAADTDFDNYVKSNSAPQGTLELGGAYKARQDQEKSKLTDSINYSLANRSDGKRVGQLNGAERQQLLDAHKFKTAIEKSRGDLTNSAADFFGNKRADSRDLYSYMPAGVEGSVQPFSGGYKVKTINGNTMTVKNAAGGGFNWTGPNDPVDADVMKYIGPAIKQARAQGK